MANYGFVYVLTNEYMPQVYKIGYTDRAPLQRVQELSASTSCPSPFEILIYGEFEDARSEESHLHDLLSPSRISAAREFFYLDSRTVVEEVVQYIKENAYHYAEGAWLSELLAAYSNLPSENPELKAVASGRGFD